MSVEQRGMLMCAGAMALLGASVAVVAALADYPLLPGQAIRYTGAATALLVGARLARITIVRPRGREWLWLLLVATVGMAGFNVFLLLTPGQADPTVVASIVGASPIVLGLLGPMLRGSRPRGRLIAGAVVVALGVTIGQGGGQSTLKGILLSLCVMACEVGFTLLAAPVLPRLGAVTVATWSSALAAPVLLTAVAVTNTLHVPRPTPTETAALVWLALATSALAFALWYAGVQRIGVARAGLFTALIPIGAILATLATTGHVHPAPLAGATVAACGLAIGISGKRSNRPASATSRETESII